jgi:Flp pilus assembly protein TadD
MGGGVVIAVLWLAAPDVDRSGNAGRVPGPSRDGSRRAEPADSPRVDRLRKEASDDLLRGQYDRARHELEQVLELMPRDAPAQRDAARAASAAGQFDYAVAALERAHHFEHHTADPELHYLRGEALFVLGRDAEARAEHHIAELEIGKDPTARMQKLWLARIYARRGWVVLADGIYETMLPPPPEKDVEVALNQADAHLINEEWTGGARLLRRYLALDPNNVRAREMLAWALEAGGDLDGELEVRRSLSDDLPTPAHDLDYGRALERAESFAAARDRYGRALTTEGSHADATLLTSYQRMVYRTTPELAGGASVRSDPQAWAWRVQAGAALPFGKRQTFGAFAWHDASTDWHANQVVGSNVLAKTGTVTGFGTQLLLARRSGASLLVGADARYTTERGTDASGAELLNDKGSFNFGGQAEGNADLSGYAHVNLHADFNEQWNEAPITVHEGGVMTGATGHLYLYPKSRVVLFDGGAQARRLSLSAQGTPDRPTANQLLMWGGIDFNLWAESSRLVRTEALDERMVRRVYLNDAGVLAYRHYELVTDSSPGFRITLAPRASIDNGTLILRKALAGGRLGFDIHGGGGYDHIQDHVLVQAGGSFVFAASWSTRLQASYDLARETATGLPGTLQIGWLTFHADI